MKYLYLAGILMVSMIFLSGCSKIDGDEIYNFFTNYKNTLDYATNCSVNNNITLNVSHCVAPKRAVFYNYDYINSSWNEMCCSFDSRCMAKTNTNVEIICSNFNASYTDLGAVFTNLGNGHMCCNGQSQCYVDTLTPYCDANYTQSVTSMVFNLSGTTEWDAMCCISGGY